MPKHQRLFDAMSGSDSSLRGALTRAGLWAGSPLYRAGNALRSAGFATGLKRIAAIGRPTLSVGNLTTGGTGKTPMVQHIVRALAAKGHRPCILLRGYKGGDEAVEHRNAVGDIARVEPDPDRVAAAQRVLADDASITCFVLDDGFQHRRAQRDLDLVLLDATNPFGFGHLLPRGLLREPLSALRRADAIVITRCDQVDTQSLAALDAKIKAITGHAPIAHAQHTWSALEQGKPNAPAQEVPLDFIAGKNVMGIVGIGNPQAFAQTLREACGTTSGGVIHCEMLPDHHDYKPGHLRSLLDLAKAANAEAVVTTQKDWVKWVTLLEDSPPNMPILRTKLSLAFADGEADLAALLENHLPLH